MPPSKPTLGLENYIPDSPSPPGDGAPDISMRGSNSQQMRRSRRRWRGGGFGNEGEGEGEGGREASGVADREGEEVMGREREGIRLQEERDRRAEEQSIRRVEEERRRAGEERLRRMEEQRSRLEVSELRARMRAEEWRIHIEEARVRAEEWRIYIEETRRVIEEAQVHAEEGRGSVDETREEVGTLARERVLNEYGEGGEEELEIMENNLHEGRGEGGEEGGEGESSRIKEEQNMKEESNEMKDIKEESSENTSVLSGLDEIDYETDILEYDLDENGKPIPPSIHPPDEMPPTRIVPKIPQDLPPLIKFFAIGADMCEAYMQRFCPEAKLLGMGRLDGWMYCVDETVDDVCCYLNHVTVDTKKGKQKQKHKQKSKQKRKEEEEEEEEEGEEEEYDTRGNVVYGLLWEVHEDTLHRLLLGNKKDTEPMLNMERVDIMRLSCENGYGAMFGKGWGLRREMREDGMEQDVVVFTGKPGRMGLGEGYNREINFGIVEGCIVGIPDEWVESDVRYWVQYPDRARPIQHK